MGRIQLALNVADLDEAVAFYTSLFGVGPAKRRPGYANFAVDDPPLKLVLFEGAGEAGSLNHLGVEVDASEEVTAAQARLADEGLEPREERDVMCCHARQDKAWVTSPEGIAWEVYTTAVSRSVSR